ncbi:MAG TPA: M1 family metallopeptidase [Thermoanaerobaculia bacterium]|nr:M1 family metallopeptidase [Thermoanaerobaculia bacterium]
MVSAKKPRRRPGLPVILLAAQTLTAAAALGQPTPLTPPIASYEISSRLDTDRHTIEATELLTWTNRTSRAAATLQLHLYLNAFRNTLSTFWKESRGIGRRGEPMRESWGSIEILRMTLQDNTDLLPTLAYISPDDGNPDDRTVAEVRLPRPVAPGETISVAIDFRSRLPRVTRRTGWKGPFWMVVQWFPKVGVLEESGWNCHQFHAWSEFFSDFGDYDVSIDVPVRYRGKVGATGKQVEERVSTAGDRVVYRFRQASVHDFAWTADPGYIVVKDHFHEAGLHDTDITLLLQPEHSGQAERHLRAARAALSGYGRVLGPYPYETLTIVDPPWGAREAGGMEYPTLITAGTSVSAPKAVHNPEGVTIHEFGHQYFYGLLASNEFEEPYLDEGFNQYMTSRVTGAAYGPNHVTLSIFGLKFPLGIDQHYPVDANRRFFPVATADIHAGRSWKYLEGRTYSAMSYSHTALALATLERLLTTPVMDRALRLYADRWRFRHPKIGDFIAAVNDTAGRDWTWFFDRTFFSSNDVDYAVDSATSVPSKPPKGLFEKDGKLEEGAPPALSKPRGWDSDVTVTRRGGTALPVEILLRFEGGKTWRGAWDGEARWTRLTVLHGPKLLEAIVDPDEKIVLDSDRFNNGRRVEKDPRAAARWTSRSVFWVQNLLDFLTVAW